MATAVQFVNEFSKKHSLVNPNALSTTSVRMNGLNKIRKSKYILKQY